MNHEEIRFILDRCVVGPMERTLTTQLNDKKQILLSQVAEFDRAIEFLKVRDAENLITQFMQASNRNYPN